MTAALRAFASSQLDEILEGLSEELPPDDREDALGRWVHHLIATGGIPDEILEGMPEVSRSDDPYAFSPQMYECGCVAVTRITDRERNRHEKPFEMRLALPCPGGESCELLHLRGNRT